MTQFKTFTDAEREALKLHGLSTAGSSQLSDAFVLGMRHAIPEGYVRVPIKPTPEMVDVMLTWGTKRSEWEMILRAAALGVMVGAEPSNIPAPTMGKLLADSGLANWINDGDLAHIAAAVRFAELVRTCGVQAAPAPRNEWAEVQRLRDLPEVDEALLNFKDDCTGDNAAMVVRAVRRAVLAAGVGGPEHG